MAAPMKHMGQKNNEVYFPLRSGASFVETRPVFSPDQKLLFACSGSIVKVYSISSGQCVHELCGHRDYVTGIAVHPKNKLQLVSCSLDQKIIIWDYTDGILLREIHRDSKLYAVYTVEGDANVYLLQQNPQNKAVCDLVTFSLSKEVEGTKGRCLLKNCAPGCRTSCIGPKNSYCAMVRGRDMIVKRMSTDKQVRHRVEKSQELTCIRGHPNGQCIATGCKDGKILLWYNFLQEDRAVKSVLHWHSLPVRDLCYTMEGSYLLSGGHECVLVKWHHDTGYKDYMPRLGAPLNHIACSSDNLMYATCYDDNVIQIVSSNFDIQQVYQGLTRGYNESRSSDPFPAGMTCDPKSQALILNGKPGHVQFYSVHEDKQLYNLDIVCQNYISPLDLEKPLTVTEVTHADFDSKGEWLATTEYWNDGVMTPEMRLKFWQFSEEKQSFVLNTTVEMPHEEKVGSLKFRPVSVTSSPGMEHMAVTTSCDGKFKIWLLVDDTDIHRTNQKWICESVGFYRNLTASEAAFSEDGSLLAVLFGSCITLWNPENNLLKETLQNTMYQDPFRDVMFGNYGSCHCLVSTTDSTLTIWSLISCNVLWSAAAKIVCMCKDPKTDVIAAFTETSDLFVFRPTDPVPVFTYAGVSKSLVLSATFVPHSKKTLYEKTTLSWQEQSELYFLNSQQELVAVSLEKDSKSVRRKEDMVSFEQNLPQSALSLLVSHHGKKKDSKTSLHKVTRQPDGKFTKEMLRSAAHVQPSVNALCRPFIQSLMIPAFQRRQHERESDDDSSDEEMPVGNYQTVSQDSGLDSDMEVDTYETQSSLPLHSSQSVTDTDSDENDSAVIKEKKSEKQYKAVNDVCRKLDKVKVIEETVSVEDLEKIFSTDMSWLTSQLKA